MVDAVTSVTNATKTYMQSLKKQDIAWERLTASQIIQYLSEGQDVPLEILRWAEEVDKIQNAPDDVTYASVNGASSTDDINNTIAQSDEPDADDAAAKQTLTQAQAFRQSMEMSGETKYNQGKALSAKSVESVQSEKAMETSLDNSVRGAQQLSSTAENKANSTEQRTSSMKQELDTLLQRVQGKDKNVSISDLNRIAELGSMLNQIGIQAQGELAQIGFQLSELEAEMQQFEAVPVVAKDFGTETIVIGAELMTNDKDQQTQITEAAKNADGINTAKVALNAAKLNTFSILFNRNYRMGMVAVKNGGNAIDAGTIGLSAINNAQSSIDSELTKINSAQLKVEQNTGVEGFAVPRLKDEEKEEESPKSEEDKQVQEKEEKSGEVKVAASKTEEKDVKDITLVIDIDEKKNRREQIGLS